MMGTNKHRAAVGLILAVVLTAAGATERSSQQWLDFMRQSMAETSYTGTFVYRYDNRVQAMRVVHRADTEGERERLVTLNGQRREIIRNDSEVTCILPESESVVVDRRQVRNPLNDMVPSADSALGSRYELSRRGDGRIAGQRVVRISIEPKDGYRYGYELAIARDSGLLLGAKVHSDEDTVIEQLMFTDVKAPATIPDSALAQTIDGDGFTWHRRASEGGKSQATASDTEWVLDPVPDGFQLAMQERHTVPGRDVMVEHWLYTDGLATVSVYIEQTGADTGAFHGRSRMGALNAYGREIGPYQVVVVGEVPAVTVETMGRAIERQNGATP